MKICAYKEIKLGDFTAKQGSDSGRRSKMGECVPWLGVESWPMSTIKLHHDWLLTEDEYPGRWLLFRSDSGMWVVVAYLRALYY